MKSITQRKHLLKLAYLIWQQEEPLGVGLKKGCWAGVAIDIANKSRSETTKYYGLSMKEIKKMIKENNLTDSEKRNRKMVMRTLFRAINP